MNGAPGVAELAALTANLDLSSGEQGGIAHEPAQFSKFAFARSPELSCLEEEVMAVTNGDVAAEVQSEDAAESEELDPEVVAERARVAWREHMDRLLADLAAVPDQLGDRTFAEVYSRLLRRLNALQPGRGVPPSSTEQGDSLLTAISRAVASMDATLLVNGDIEPSTKLYHGDIHLLLEELIPNMQSCLGAIDRAYGKSSAAISSLGDRAQDNSDDGPADPLPLEQLAAEAAERTRQILATRDAIDEVRRGLQRARGRMRNTASKLRVDAEAAAALDRDISALVEANTDPEEDARKEAIKSELESILKTRWAEGSLHIFGSSKSTLGFAGCDMDLCLVLPMPKNNDKDAGKQGEVSENGAISSEVESEAQHQQDEQESHAAGEEEDVNEEEEEEVEGAGERQGGKMNAAKEFASNIVTEIAELLSADQYAGMFEKVEAIPTARVPIVKLVHASTGLQCDIGINSTLGVLNTKLLRVYAELDPRVRPLAFAIKHWARSRGVNDPVHGTLSSYAWVIMLIHFLQHRTPPVLCCLQDFRLVNKNPAFRHKDGIAFCDDVDMARAALRKPNTESIGALLHNFFLYFAHTFSVADSAVSVRMTDHLAKRNYRASTTQRKWRIAVQDPLDPAHDLGSVIYDPQGQTLVLDELARACEFTAAGDFAALCQQREDIEPIERLCNGCGEGGHISKECPVGQSACRNCGKLGHFLRDCSEPPGAAVGACHRCGGRGHWARNCDGVDRRACNKCGEVGHLQRDCPQQKQLIQCHGCGDLGHMARECPGKQRASHPQGAVGAHGRHHRGPLPTSYGSRPPMHASQPHYPVRPHAPRTVLSASRAPHPVQADVRKGFQPYSAAGVRAPATRATFPPESSARHYPHARSGPVQPHHPHQSGHAGRHQHQPQPVYPAANNGGYRYHGNQAGTGRHQAPSPAGGRHGHNHRDGAVGGSETAFYGAAQGGMAIDPHFQHQLPTSATHAPAPRGNNRPHRHHRGNHQLQQAQQAQQVLLQQQPQHPLPPQPQQYAAVQATYYQPQPDDRYYYDQRRDAY